MKNHLVILLALCALLLLVTAGVSVVAQSSANFNLEWNVIGNGGGVSTSAGYRVNGTIGQDLSSQPKSGSASYAVSSGYWYANIASYLPVVVSD